MMIRLGFVTAAAAAFAFVWLNMAIAVSSDAIDHHRPDSQAHVGQPKNPKMQPSDAAGQVIKQAVVNLIADAKKLGDYQQEQGAAVLSRPHPAVARIDPGLSLLVLDRMLESFTDNTYMDTFIRWHLMHVVNQASQKYRKQMGPKLVKLVKQMPELLRRSERREYWYIPEDVYKQYEKIYAGLQVVIGYPPFQQRINPPGSISHMNEARRAEARALWTKALKLREMYKTVSDQAAIVHNRRIREVNWIVRQYRGELIYAILWTGDPEMARFMLATIKAHAQRNDGIAMDLLAFWYLAAFNGALDLYKPALLSELSRKLERTARANEAWFGYQHRQRNFADYAFHLIYVLREGDTFSRGWSSSTKPTDH